MAAPCTLFILLPSVYIYIIYPVSSFGLVPARASNLCTFRESVAINMEPLELGAGRGDGRRPYIITSYGLTRRIGRFLPQILSFL